MLPRLGLNIGCTSLEQILYVEALVDAFLQIDVNGDETLEWDEFSNYIVETGIARQKKSFIDVIRNYHLSKTKDIHKHEAEISKVFYFHQLKHLIVLENSSKKLKVYDYVDAKLLHSFVAHSGSVLAAEYLHSQKLVVTSGADNCLMFWDPKNYTLVNKIPTREIQIVLKWSNSQKLLVTGGFDNVINCYKDLQFEENGKLKSSVNLISLKQIHENYITDILIIESCNLIVACDLDGIITLWYLNTFENKNKLAQHQKGVLSLACLESKNYLLSCGYEHEVYIWDLIVGKHISSLTGHSQSLIAIKVFNGTNQIITGDVSGIFKIWDVRSFSVVQTFSLPAGLNKRANSFCITNINKKRIIVGSDKVYFFDYEESQEGNLADSKPCIAVMYNDIFNVLITAHLDCIKLWDTQTGVLKQVFRDITNSEISYVAFDTRKRKLFIGDVEGKLTLINILNGVQMKFFTQHKDYISSMAYYNKGKKFISASWDGYFKIHDDNSPDEMGLQLFEFRYKVPNQINSCNSIDFNERLEILASGYDNGYVTLMNMKTLSSEGILQDHKKISIVKFINDLPCLIVCDSGGVIHFWSLVHSKPKKPVKDFIEENKSINEYNIKENFPVKCLCVEEKTNTLLTGDDTGYIKAWDIGNYLKYLREMSELKEILYSELEITVKASQFESNFAYSVAGLAHMGKYEDQDPVMITETKNKNKLFSSNVITLDKLSSIRDALDLKATLKKEWKAHKNGVTSLTCFSDPVFYASSGLDLKVHVWSENFENIGSLITNKDPHWSLKINIEQIKETKKQKAIETFNEVKLISYESLFEKTIN
jgi:WD40 repeat protein